MNQETYLAVRTQGGIVDLTSRAKFLLTGADRVRYLNGQITQDVRKANAASTIYGCVTNLKGRVEADIFIHTSQTGEEGLWLDAPTELRETLAMRLERYIIADDVELRDETENWTLFHAFGATAEPYLEKAGTEGVVKSWRYGIEGIDLWSITGSAPESLPKATLTPEDLEEWRILQGIPQWPAELNPEAFPQEAGLEARVMDFYKGCYIGQEILSRIKTTGKMPRKLVRFFAKDVQTDAPKVQPGWSLWQDQPGGAPKEVGSVTSCVRHPELDQQTGLAYVRAGGDAQHSVLLAGEDPAKLFVEVEILPL